MYNADKFHWLPLQPGTERFVMNRGPFGNFDTSNLTPEQSSAFFGTTATVAESGVKLRTLYVWESDTDRFTYVYNESGKIIAAYPPPEDYDPYALAQKQIESEPNITPERRDFLLKFLDPTRVVLSAAVSDGPIPISPSIFEPILLGEAPLPGGFVMLQGGEGEPEGQTKTISWAKAPPGFTMTIENPGSDVQIPIWVCQGPDFAPGSYTWEGKTVASSPGEVSWTDQASPTYAGRYYYIDALDTTYVQSPGPTSLTLKYITTRNISPTAYIWTTWADPPEGDRKSVEIEGPSDAISMGDPPTYTAYIYLAEFQGLSPDTVYKYWYTWSEGCSGLHYVRTAPANVSDFSFIVYGDNRWDDSSATFNHRHCGVASLGILNRGSLGEDEYPAFILHTGDMVHDGGHADEWIPHFFGPAGALISRFPVFPCVGNHELGGDSSASNYRDLFTLPDVDPEDPHDAERWYSFDYGRCHFICLDTDSDFSTTSDQYKWLIKGDHPKYETGDLPEAWKGKTSYGTLDRIFVFFHRPAYSSGPHRGEQEAEDLRTILVPKFKQYKVDVVFSGHEHLYERISEGGIQYVVTGGGGAPEAAIVLSHTLAQWGAVREEWCDYTRRPDDWRHYCVVSVSGEDSDVSLRVNSWKQSLIDWWPREE